MGRTTGTRWTHCWRTRLHTMGGRWGAQHTRGTHDGSTHTHTHTDDARRRTTHEHRLTSGTTYTRLDIRHTDTHSRGMGGWGITYYPWHAGNLFTRTHDIGTYDARSHGARTHALPLTHHTRHTHTRGAHDSRTHTHTHTMDAQHYGRTHDGQMDRRTHARIRRTMDTQTHARQTDRQTIGHTTLIGV